MSDLLRARTLAELLEAAAARGPADALAYAEPGRGTAVGSYAALRADAGALLGALRDAGLARGEPLLLLHEAIRGFLSAFWACQLGGLVAVPLGLPPAGADPSEEARRLLGAWRTMNRPAVLCERHLAGPVGAALHAAGAEARVLVQEDLAGTEPAALDAPVDPGALALVQFSSGSTSAPRGVRLTHANLLANARQMVTRAPLTARSVELGWMPHYHDMGLIGLHLAPLVVAARQVKMAPGHYLRRPLDWLDLATRHRATLLSGTNAGTRLLLRKLARAEAGRWDLAAVEAIYLGAEPIAPATVRELLAALAPHGLRPEAIRVAYGLAEASVGVAMGEPGRPPRWRRLEREGLARRQVVDAGDALAAGVVELMVVGAPLDGIEARLVDDADAAVGPGAVGHLQVRGPNVTAGYVGDAGATAAAFCDGWLRTGDLAFLDEGRLVVCGRTKELLFAGGRNLYATDVEAVAARTPGIRAAVAAVAPADGGAEERTLLFLVPEAADWRDAVAALNAARRRVVATARLPVDVVIPIGHRDIPRTTSGKPRRFRLAERFAAGAFAAAVAELEERTRAARAAGGALPAAAAELLPLVVEAWAGALGCDVTAVGPDDHFSELSGSSVVAVDILTRLEGATGRWLGYDVLLDCETPSEMARWLASGHQGRAGRAAPAPAAPPGGAAIAIVGLGCRLPDAPDPDAFWRNLAAGVDSIRPPPAGRWAGHDLAGLRCRTGSFLDDPYRFDAAFFGIPDDEAAAMDPQQRLLLEVACECLARGGYGGGRRDARRVGVFVGASGVAHGELVVAQGRSGRAPHPTTLVGNLLNMLAARVAHELDLRGPALAVDTACSSALVAVHLACESLRRGECDLAIAGGVNLNLTPTAYRLFEAAGALSPSGRSRPFAADADGFVPGEGAGAVLLRPLDAALADGDPVLAVIRGSAINNDGRSLGAMAPNPDGQLEALRAAWAAAGVAPATVSAVECHGTGTRIGDPVELRSVAAVGGEGGGPLFVGSVKSNLGHLLGAAGVAGLLKMVLALCHRTLPATLHAEPPLSALAGASRLALCATTRPWDGPAPLRAGVSAFGFGGTNCHVVLEEAPGVPAAGADAPGPRLLALAAPSAAHLAADAASLAAAGVLDGPTAGAAAAELRAGRPALPWRAARVLAAGEPAGPALAALAAVAAEGRAAGWTVATAGRRAPRVAWLFPGQGAQHFAQALGLYQGWPAFRARFDALDEACGLRPSLAARCWGAGARPEALQRTDVAQPLLVAFQIALGEALVELGLRPAAVLGHSVGELAAACLAGALEPAHAVRLAARRGALMEALGGEGAMLAVPGSRADVEAALGPLPDGVAWAAENGPHQTVLAGPRPALTALEATLAAAGLRGRPVPVRHAFHSPLMDEAAAALGRSELEFPARGSSIPLVSSVTGALLDGRDLTLAYLARQIREPVRFAAAFEALAGLGVDAFLDVGPAAVLAGLARSLLPAADARSVVACGRPPDAPDEDADVTHLLGALGRLWVLGAPLATLPVGGGARPRPSLPPLPFLGRRHVLPGVEAAPRATVDELLHVRRFVPVEERAAPLCGTWVVVGGQPDEAEAVAAALAAGGAHAVRAQRGAAFAREAEAQLTLDPTRRDHARWLLEAFAGAERGGLVLLAGGAAPEESFAALAALAQAARAGRAAWPLLVSTRAALPARAGELPDPEQAAVAALAGALGREASRLTVRVVDLPAASPAEVASALVAELGVATAEPVVARRAGARLAPRLQPVFAPTASRPLERGGAWLVIGGTGGVGSALCRWLADPAGGAARAVVVAGRRDAAAVRPLLDAIAACGAQAEHAALDLLDAAATARVVAAAATRHGRLRGVVHCAGAIDVGALENREAARLRLVLDTKIVGARHLAAAVAGQPVDRVVLVSSVAALVPALGRGLADYAAANAFLDAFAAGHGSAETSWTAVAYSRWRGTGLGAGLAELAAGPLRHPLDPAAAARAFGAALGTGEPHVVVADPADVAAWAADAPPPPSPSAPAVAAAPAPPVATFAAVPVAVPVAAPTPAALAPAASATGADAEESLEALLRERLALATGLAPDELEAETPFQRLGLSSLAAVDLVKELEGRVGRPLDATLLFEHNTLGRVLAFLGEAGPARAAAAAGAPRATGSPEAFPLLPAQQTFYANQAFFPHLPGYVFLRLDLVGELDVAALDEALAFLGRRHPMLGVVFDWHDGKLRQRHAGLAARVEVRELADGAPAAREAALLAWELEVRNRVQDLARGPLLRVCVARTGAGRHSLFLNVHHIVADAWSAQLLATELLELHAQRRAGGALALPPLRSSFAECVAAVEAQAAAGGADSLAYWSRALAGAPTALALPYDGDPRAEVRGSCQLLQRVLEAPATAALERAARAWDASFFQVLLASYLVALERWSGQGDLVVRVANARREARLADIGRVVGCFADSLPLRVRVERDASARQLCAAVGRVVLEAQRHPLASSMALAGLSGDRDHVGPRGVTPAGLSFPNFPAPERFGELAVVGMRAGSASGFTQLGLIAWTFGGRLHLSWNTIDGLFRPATVERLSAEHLQVLRALAADATGETTVGRLWPVPAARGAVVPAAGPLPLPAAPVVHERVFARAAERADEVAVVAGGREVRYGELARRAGAVGATLVELGAAAGERVGLLCRPGPEAVAGVLGVLASGAAYVPIDPEYPDARVGRIAAHARFRALVTTADQLARLAAFEGSEVRHVVVLDEPAPLARTRVPATMRLVPGAAAGEDAAPPPPGRAKPDDLAYVLYTSGTTGAPKGAMVSHRALTMFHDWVHGTLGVTPADRFIQTAPLSFGSSLRQVYSPLLAGARLYTTPRGLARDPRELARFLEAHRITVWNSVPTLSQLLLDAIEGLELEGEPIRLEHLRWVLIGGEDLPPPLVRRWWDRFGRRHRIVNVYGGAETVTNALFHEVRERPADDALRIPVGRGAAGADPVILDEAGGVAADGVVGEIAIGGDKLALGYLDDPERTAAAFVPDPRGPGRVYRTGDLGRREADGEIVFLGRADSQVKLHGHRVELSEIEATLNGHPAVRAAAVIVEDDGARRLVAYVEPARAGAACAARELRAHVERLLPAYMVPQRFESVEALPRNAIGKIDRRALASARPASEAAPPPAPGATPRPPAVPAVAPAPASPPGATEALVAAVWREVLRVPEVGPDDDFFELGGDSLLALEVLQRLRGRVPALPRPITFYGERTLARLAAAIDALAGGLSGAAPGEPGEAGDPSPPSAAANAPAPPPGAAGAPASPRVAAGTPVPPPAAADGRRPLTPTQESFVLAQRLRPDAAPVWCARLPLAGALDPALFQRALAAVVERHALLRTVFETDADLRTWQRELAPQGAPLATLDLSAAAPSEQEARLDELFTADGRSRFALDRWPPWRFRLVALGADRWELVVTMHHAVADGWSLHVLGAELLAAYRQLARGGPVRLPPLGARLADAIAAAGGVPTGAHAEARRFWADRFARPWPDARRTAAGAAGARRDAAERGAAGVSGAGGAIGAAGASGDAGAAASRDVAGGGSPHYVLDETATGALRRAAAAARRSLHAVLLTAWARALRTLLGDPDVVIGCALAGRDLPLPDAERLFGPLATVLPLRLAPSGGDFAADLADVDGAFVEACRHAALPVDELLRQIPRHPGAPFPPGRQLFLSYMDFGALPPIGDAELSVDLDRARFHFAAQATETELMLGVLAGGRLRLHVHGQAGPGVRRRALDLLAAELGEFAPAAAGPAPAGSAVPADPGRAGAGLASAGLAGAGSAPAGAGLSPAGSAASPRLAIDAAVVTYLPEPRRLAAFLPPGLELAEARALVRATLFPSSAPLLVEVQETSLGRSGAVVLPLFADEIDAAPPDDLAGRAAAAAALAEAHGARCVSFAGRLPAATGYDVAIARARARRGDAGRARLTTGHAATAAAVVASVVRAVEAVGARLPDLAVAVIGFGSIGQAALRLLLTTQPRPRALAVCDLARERAHLADPLAAVEALAGAPVEFLPWDGGPPAGLARFGLLIGAAGAGGLLDVDALPAGTLLVDDSFPPLCDEAAALRRMRERADVLVVGGGTLAITPRAVTLPVDLPGDGAAAALRAFAGVGMPGCRAESLLCSLDPALPTIEGLVWPEQAARFWEALARLGIGAAPLHLGATPIPAAVVEALRGRAGR